MCLRKGMAELKTIIAVDGENFRNALRQFNFRSNPPHPNNQEYRLEEHHFLWRDFFRGVIDRFNERTGWDHRLVRVYWYYARQIVPWQERANLAQRVVQRYQQEIPQLTTEIVISKAKEWYDRESSYFNKQRDDVLEGIQRSTDFLEFKYVVQYVVRPFDPYILRLDAQTGELVYRGTQAGEKGVDLGIAVDLISKLQNYDAAILISGDADYLPLVNYLKDNLKAVYQFSLAKGVPPEVRYLSQWLQGAVDCFASFDERELLQTYLDRSARIPPTILEAIDNRIESLQ